MDVPQGPFLPHNFYGVYGLLQGRVRPRFFDQVGHETMDAYSGNKHFFTKSCHRQPYQNYEQSRQIWVQFQKIKYLKNQNFQKHFLIKVGLLVKYSSQKLFLERFNQFLTQKNDFENTNFEMFEEVVHNFGKFDDDMIQ